MSLNTQRIGQIGVNVVEQIVLKDWKSRWQPLDAQNDDGVDGLIFLESNGEATGQVVYAQVKTYKGKPDKSGVYHVPIGISKLNVRIERWRRLVGAAIVIYVDQKDLNAYWVDAKRIPNDQSQILVPAHQKFDGRARRVVSALCGSIHRDLRIRRIVAEPGDFDHLIGSEHIKVAARNLYRNLQRDPVRLGGAGPVVAFKRSGWRHITRKGRPRLTRYQSFVLLGVARRILESTDEIELISDNLEPHGAYDLVSARAAVSFPFRQTAIVKVILRAPVPELERGYEFHTIYEARRRRDVLGVREPLSQ